MARQVRFLSSFLFLSCFFIACREQQHDAENLPYFNAKDLVLQNRNGIVYKDNLPFTGKVFQLFPTTHDTSEIVGYYKGKEHGEWKRFYPNKQLEELRYYDEGVKIKTLTRWWRNGQIQFACTFENGEYEGVLKEWNENGQLVKAMHYKNGYEEGSQKLFYDNGKVRSNYVMKNGKRIGLLGTKNCVNVSDSVFKK